MNLGMARKPQVTVIIPCHNEAPVIGNMIYQIRETYPFFQILVVDNNSSDRTAEIARALGVMVLYENRLGKGFAVRTAFNQITEGYVVMIDGDNTYDLHSLRLLISELELGADMVVAQRYAVDPNSFPPLHKVGNALFSKLHESIFHSGVIDAFSGFRAFNLAFIKSFSAESKGFELETDLNFHARLVNARVTNVSSPYRQRIEGSSSKLSTIRDGFLLLVHLFRVMLQWRPLKLLFPVSLLFVLVGLLLISQPILEFINFRFIYKVPSLISGFVLIQVSLVLLTFAVHFSRLARIEASVIATHFKILKNSLS